MASPEDMTRTMIANMPAKTGRSLDEWVELAAGAPGQSHNEVLMWLKSVYGLTHGYANLATSAHLAPSSVASNSAATQAERLASQYAGKEHLRPIYDRIVSLVQSFGDDVEISPRKAFVSLRRRKQIAIIRPSTKTRVDLGLCLRGVEPVGRLEPSGGFSAMVSHRVRLTSLDEVDDELRGWLKMAYRLS